MLTRYHIITHARALLIKMQTDKTANYQIFWDTGDWGLERLTFKESDTSIFCGTFNHKCDLDGLIDELIESYQDFVEKHKLK